MSLSQPVLKHFPQQFYAAVRVKKAIPFGSIVTPSWREAREWLVKQGVTDLKAPFIRYLTTDMSRELDMELGYTTPSLLQGDGRIHTGLIPAGLYAFTVYTGTVRGKGLMKATGALLDWLDKNGHRLASRKIDQEVWWQARYEFYVTDPALEPDMHKWQTELRFMVTE